MKETRLRRCFELSGVVPLGVYLLVHLSSYARALFGSEEFGLLDEPGLALSALGLLLVWLPLVFHAAYGAWLSTRPLPETRDQKQYALLMRGSGLLALGFLVWHAAWFSWPLKRGRLAPEDVAERLAATLSSTSDGVPWFAALHLLGLGVVCAHFGWGFARFLEGWGVTRARAARLGAGLLSAALFGLGAATLIELATGSILPRFAR
jgi:succinate dehydrogenase / fumarate reductase, cytochrome b subunit